MDMAEIMNIIIAIAPPLSAIIGVIVAVLKNKSTSDNVIEKFEEVRQEVFNTKEYTELKDQLLIAHQENIELKHRLDELLTKIDKVKRK